MFRKILLLLCIAFAVVGFGYPCVIMPYTNYTISQKLGDSEIKATYNFKLNGKVSVSGGLAIAGSDMIEQENYYYKLDFKHNQVLISDNKDFENAKELPITSFYNIGNGAKNKVAMYTSIGVGVAAILLVVTIPSRKKR